MPEPADGAAIADDFYATFAMIARAVIIGLPTMEGP